MCDPGSGIWVEDPKTRARREARPGDEFGVQSVTGLLAFKSHFLSRIARFDLPHGVSNIDGRLFAGLREKRKPFKVHIHWPQDGKPARHNHVPCIGDIEQSLIPSMVPVAL